MTIVVEIDETYEASVSVARLRAAAEAALGAEQMVGDATIIVTDDAAIAELNRDFLGQEGATDVLSFPMVGDADDGFVLPPETAPYLGDIVIAYPYTVAQARAGGREVAAELDLLVVHGVLHLLGYDHDTLEAEAAMWARQDAILSQLGEG